ncbi:histidine-rich glycoprotein [Camelus bactrianus]|uniref:Histidine-rich glycoprotein n=1 Tax=Camelus bactrianus TaxID=9837 RepID=A0A9W3EVF5_CAMBA|nr:histidine-rich glycoprotein [Camelus bactrianus]
MKLLPAALPLVLLVTLRCSSAVSPTDCNDAEPVARKALDLINKGRRDGYLFQLLRVADAHLDKAESIAVYYLVLDVKESDCPVLSRKHWDDCELDFSRRPSDIVIGQCKVIATTCLDESQDLRVNDFNCTTSSVSSALANTKDSPVLFDFFEDTELYREEADKALEKYKKENSDFASFRVDQVKRVSRARGEERTNYYVDFSVRNCSRYHFPGYFHVFGFCRAYLSYDAEAFDLAPQNIVINCEVFNPKEHHLGHPLHSGEHEHPPADRPPFKPGGPRGHRHPCKPHEFGCPPPLEGKSHSGRPPFPAGPPPPFPAGPPPPFPPPELRCRHPYFGTNGAHGPPHNYSSSEHHPYGHRPHGHHPHGHHPHGHRPHGHHPHGHHPHGHHPHGHDFHDHGPCDPPPHNQGPEDHHRRGPPPRHSGERGPGKGHFPFHWRQIGYVHRLPPLKTGEVLPLPGANFPSFSLPNHNNPLQPEIQPFPQSASESCPGTFNNEFLHISKFFAYTSLK